ncbi:MAG: hypothetical protein CMH59_05070, partial [Myxococcales bacterium]|nr:hypothetical protein [Myxococcales bacterium]
MDSLVGTVLDGRYRVRRLLGRGGMGAVWEAEQLRLGRTVALKTLHSSLAGRPDVVERFRREAMAAASVGSPHIVDVYDLGVLPRGAPFMVMEYLPGQDLAELIAERGPLAPGDAVHVLAQACDALGAAHEAGIVHRDVKSENVMVLARRGDPLFVKVVDFGVSKLRDSSLTGTADLLGTPYAMAPEQLRASRDVDARADVYALGVVLHHALSGRLPFEAATLPALIVAITEGQPRSLREVRPGLPAALYDIVEAAMARDPAARFQSCAALASALRSVEVASASAPDAFAATMAVEPAGPADEPAPGLGAPRTERGFAAPGEDDGASGGDGEVGVQTRHGFAEASTAPTSSRSAPEAGTFSAEPASFSARGSPPQPGRQDGADAEEARGSARATSARGSLAPWIVLLVLLGGGGLAAAYRAELRAAWRDASATHGGARGAGAANDAPPDEPARAEGAAPAGGVEER